MARTRPTRRCLHPLGALAAALLLATAGCAARVVKTPVYEASGVRVFLRAQHRGDQPVDLGFSHPLTIAPARITNILSRIDVRSDDEGGRRPAISSELLFPIGEGVAKAFEAADPSQVVVVMAQERKRTHAIFTNDYLTSLLLWADGDHLFVQLGELGTALSRDPRDKPREPELGKPNARIQVVGGDAMTPQGPALVAVRWRDNVFRDTSAIRMRPGGEVVRRTILMEAPPEADDAGPGPAAPPDGLSPEALRALADLEEARRGGALTEAEYQEQRRLILSGQAP